MKWQYLCPKEGEYRFEPIDQLMAFCSIARPDPNQPSMLSQTC